MEPDTPPNYVMVWKAANSSIFVTKDVANYRCNNYSSDFLSQTLFYTFLRTNNKVYNFGVRIRHHDGIYFRLVCGQYSASYSGSKMPMLGNLVHGPKWGGHFKLTPADTVDEMFVAKDCLLLQNNEFDTIPLIGMPAKRITIIRKELAKLLRRYEISEEAIEQFVDQSGDHLRLALKARAKKLAIQPSSVRWPRDRLEGENPVEYIRRVYGDMIDYGGMNQSDLAKIDKTALRALRHYCYDKGARPTRPRVSEIIPPSKKNPDDVVANFGELTYENSWGAWKRNKTPENLARKRAYNALMTRNSRKRNHDPT